MDFYLPPGVLALTHLNKLNAKACNAILQLMWEITKIEGDYVYDNRGDLTLLYINPADRTYINDEREYQEVMIFFSKLLAKVIDEWGDQALE